MTSTGRTPLHGERLINRRVSLTPRAWEGVADYWRRTRPGEPINHSAAIRELLGAGLAADAKPKPKAKANV